MRTGFILVDGDESGGRAPALPRPWLVCAGLVIIAQWVLELGWGSVYFLAHNLSGAGLFFSTFAAPEAAGLFIVVGMVAGYGLLGIVILVASQRFDGRAPRDLGLSKAALVGSAPWIVVALLAAIPHALWLSQFLTTARFEELVAAAAVLVPATIVQAGVEEVLFRGFILASLAARYGVRAGIVISGVLFALWHVSPLLSSGDWIALVGGAFVFGITAALVALHQGHLGGAIALHVVWNVVSDLGGMVGVSSLPEQSVWEAYAVQSVEPWLLDDLLGEEGRYTFFLPLLLETMLVLALCRLTVFKILARDEAS